MVKKPDLYSRANIEDDAKNADEMQFAIDDYREITLRSTNDGFIKCTTSESSDESIKIIVRILKSQNACRRPLKMFLTKKIAAIPSKPHPTTLVLYDLVLDTKTKFQNQRKRGG